MVRKTSKKKTKYYDPEGTCIICGYYGVDLHHIKTRGSGGIDKPWNLVKLCHAHHVEVDHYGDRLFGEKYSKYKEYLDENGWELNPITNKYYRPVES